MDGRMEISDMSRGDTEATTMLPASWYENVEAVLVQRVRKPSSENRAV
jgi:hypothetical protein